MRKLTKQDTPFLLKTIEWWAANFPFSLDRAQLITWAEQFPDSVVDKSLNVTAGWFARQKAKCEQEPSNQRPRISMDEMKQGVSLVAVASKSVALEKRADEFWGCCPLHSETSPSFVIKQRRGFELFFCQGCGKGGDVLTFIELIEHLSKEEALARLYELYKKEKALTQTLPSEQDTYRYATACMRNIARARTTAENLLGVEL